jgi:hypothetical protein
VTTFQTYRLLQTFRSWFTPPLAFVQKNKPIRAKKKAKSSKFLLCRAGFNASYQKNTTLSRMTQRTSCVGWALRSFQAGTDVTTRGGGCETALGALEGPPKADPPRDWVMLHRWALARTLWLSGCIPRLCHLCRQCRHPQNHR